MNENDVTSSHYRSVQIDTSTTLDLVQMAYDGMIDNLDQASEILRTSPIAYDDFNEKMGKAQQILSALDDGLDETRGDLPVLLAQFYQFIRQKLIECNMQKSEDTLSEVLELVKQVRIYWEVEASEPDATSTNIQDSSRRKVDLTG